MPQGNLFRHQAYTPTHPTSPHHLLSPGFYPAVGSEPFRRRMGEVGAALRAARVAAVYLVHGSFVGSDALGVFSELQRIFPGPALGLRRLARKIVDQISGDWGNYTASFARLFESSINRPAQRRIPVRLFEWSSENHHLGRADGAVRLIDELASLELEPGERLLLWGHSHAGNVFALMTNLLGGGREAAERFFKAAEIYYRWPILGWVDVPVWERVYRRLQADPPPLSGVGLDLVTFGTPIRYGWDSAGYSRLLHFIHHRPAKGLPAYRAPFPPKLTRVKSAADGDYVQQLGIAGTNIMPSLFAWRAWLADRRLHRVVQSGLPEGSLLERFQAGAIVPEEGTTLLVDYGQQEGNIARHHAGHAVYTRKAWLLFHAEEVVRRFYAARDSMVA